MVAEAEEAYYFSTMSEFKRLPSPAPQRTLRNDETDAVASLFPGSRAQAVAEGRADRKAGRVYDAETVERWMADWDTDGETELPPAPWHDRPRHGSGSGL